MTRPEGTDEGADLAHPGSGDAQAQPVRATAASTEAMIRASIEGSPDEVCVLLPIFDAAGTFVDAEIRYANRTARNRAFGGLPVASIEGVRLFERWPGARPLLFDRYAQVASTGEPSGFEFETTGADGEPRHEEALVFAAEGGLVYVGRDATGRALAAQALRDSEARYADLVAGLPVGVYTAHSYADGRVVFDFVSDRMGEILAVNPAAARGDARAAFSKVHPDDLPSLRRAIAEDFTSHSGLHWEGRVVADGVTRIVRVFSVRVEVRGDALVAHGIIEDVTERRALERRLAASARLEAVGRLAGGVAHEFNNTLLGILGTAELIAETLTPGDPLLADIETILAAGRRAAALSKQLQAFGQQQTLQPAAIDLRLLLRELEPAIRRAAGPGVDVEIQADPEAPVVFADRAAIDEVVLTLVGHARGAMPGGGRLLVSACAEDVAAGSPSRGGIPAGRYGCLCVEDGGDPIDSDAMGRLFEPFYSSTHMGRGTGLGLATIQGTVLQSNGWVDVRHGERGGTLFSVLLPVAQARATTASPAPAPSPDVTGRPLTILLVDDEEIVRTGVARGLRRLGHIVHEAARPGDVLELPDDRLAALDVLVTDVLMPGMHGGSLATRMRERRADLPVLFISGYTPDEALRPHLHEPATGFLAKPFDRRELLAAIDAVVREGARD